MVLSIEGRVFLYGSREGNRYTDLVQEQFAEKIHFNRFLTTEYSETAAHFKGNFDTDNQIYVPQPKRKATFRKQFI
jgi:hypothetical protein